MLSKSSDNSFDNVDEKVTSDFDKISEGISPRGLFQEEEFSAIQKFNEVLELKEESSILSNKLKLKINEVKKAQMFLSSTELEQFIRLEEYLNSIEDKDIASIEGEIDQSMDLEYIDNIRKQQEVMTRLLKQITQLQWEVEQGYNKIKEIEHSFKRTKSPEPDCKLFALDTSPVCTCEIF